MLVRRGQFSECYQSGRSGFVFGRCSVRMSTGTPAIMTEVFLSLTQSLQVNVGIVS
jgi:hypothetical protein